MCATFYSHKIPFVSDSSGGIHFLWTLLLHHNKHKYRYVYDRMGKNKENFKVLSLSLSLSLSGKR